MNRSRWIAVTIAVLTIIAAAVLWRPEPMLSPGPMLAGHAAIAGECRSCHLPLRGTPAAKCIGCHALADIGLHRSDGAPISHATPRVAFHQQLATPDCVACHGEHRGPLAAGALPHFSHAQLKPTIQAQCESCHRKPDGALHRKLGGNCQQCHASSGWKPARFEHQALFALSGPHDTTCANCHVGGDTTQFTCYGCHEHQPASIAARHRREGITDIANCVQCHRSADDDEAESPGDRGDP
ncbi:MAG: cytochrome c3 family protein [Nevskia sp.]|nr:cytochrome c3 family protein [Nevskia sp.]